MSRTLVASFVVLLVAESASGQFTQRVSITESGVEPDAMCYGSTESHSISENGRFVVFQSDATNLVTGDTNRGTDVFVKDLRTGAIDRVSVDSSGVEGNQTSYGGVISADGRYVAFRTWSALDPGDTNTRSDVYVRDRQLGTTTRVSLTSTGGEPDEDCGRPSMSADGRFIVFASGATNLVPGDTNRKDDVFLVDMTTGSIERVSIDSSGAEANGHCASPTVSDDGSRIAFDSRASNLGGTFTDGAWDAFVRDRAAGVTECVSIDKAGVPRGGGGASISGDGSTVAFTSDDSYVISGDTNSVADVFVRDLAAGVTTRVSVDSSGNEGDGASVGSGISTDGTRIVFISHATNLVSGDTNGYMDAFLHDRTTGTTERTSVRDFGGQANGESEWPAISPNGRWAVFTTTATNLDPSDTGWIKDVYVRSLDGAHARRAKYGAGLAGELGIPPIFASAAPVIGLDFELHVGDSSSGTIPGVLLVGFAQASLPYKGGTILVDWTTLVPLTLVPPEIVLTTTIPDDHAFNGLVVDLQALEFDPAAVQGISMTRGFELTLGY